MRILVPTLQGSFENRALYLLPSPFGVAMVCIDVRGRGEPPELDGPLFICNTKD
jgi:hypothetical protein